MNQNNISTKIIYNCIKLIKPTKGQNGNRKRTKEEEELRFKLKDIIDKLT